MSGNFGRYTVLRQLGKGAMGVVYLATDPLLNRQVAVKTVELGAEADPEEREFMRTRLFRDARAAAVLRHPNIVAIYDVFEDGGRAYVVMEFVEGDNLSNLLKSNPLPPASFILKVIGQMANALDYTHSQGVIHRDIKPANVMIDATGGAKIMDFGIARITDARTCTPTGMVMGTVEYMAPEQIMGAVVDGRADQFALAVVAYQMMTASSLYGPNSLATLTYKLVNEAPQLPTTRNATLPRGVDAVLAKGLSKNPADRFPTCGDFVGALARAYSDAPTSPLPSPTAQVTVSHLPTTQMLPASQATNAAPPARSSKGPLIAALMAVLVLAGALVAVVWKPWDHASPETVATETATPTSPAEPPVPRPAAVAKTPSEPTSKAEPKSTPPVEAKVEPEPVKPTTPPAAKVPEPVEPMQEPDVTAMPPEPRNGGTPYGQAMQQGEQQVRQNEYPGAIASFSKALAFHPKSAQALYSRAMSYQHLEQMDAAMKDYIDALHLDPKLVMAYIGLGGCLVHLHRDSEALNQYQRAIELRPEAVVALTGRGNIYMRRKEYRLALADYDKALSVNARYAPALMNRAHAREALGDFAGAAADRESEAAARNK